MAQTIKITQAQFAQLKNALQAEAALKFPRCKEYCNLKDYQDISPIQKIMKKGNKIFLTKMQRKFFDLFLKLNLNEPTRLIIQNV